MDILSLHGQFFNINLTHLRLMSHSLQVVHLAEKHQETGRGIYTHLSILGS